MMKAIAAAIALFLSSILVVGCGKGRAEKPHMGEVERLPRLETVVMGNPRRLEVVHSYTATLEAYERADLCAMVRGYLKSVPPDLDIGRPVKKNEALLALSVPDLLAERDNKRALVELAKNTQALAQVAVHVAEAEVKEAQAMLQRYESDLTYRKLQHARISRLAQAETLSPQQVEEAKAQLDATYGALGAAQAAVLTRNNKLQAALQEQQVAAARVQVANTEFERAQVQVQFAEVRAPFDGIITRRWVDSGATVKDAGVPLLTIARTDKVRVILDVPEHDVQYFQAGPQGNPVELFIPALADVTGGEKIHGRITLTSSALDPVTRTMRAEMLLENQIGNRRGILLPQMTGTAYVTLTSREARTLPASALVRTKDKLEIYLVADPTGDPPRGTVKRMEVQIGVDDGRRVEIRNKNLTGRELVIVKGAGILRPGDQVISIPSKPAE